MYQKLTVDCNAQDPTYTGEWYCANVKVCESYMSSKRQCMTTRGCAKEAECEFSAGNTYAGDTALLNYAGKSPAGMTITPECCSNSKKFADDDGAVDYSVICNSSARSITYSAMLAVGLTVFASLGALF